MGRLDGKTALVAGASGSIGGAGATMLASEGAAVVCGDVDGAAAEACAAAIRAAGGKAVAVTLDGSLHEVRHLTILRTHAQLHRHASRCAGPRTRF
jgi:NAD(P)-dependent dehydrogenase (short-subunit alcohol dehydrogenase family)